MNLSLVPPFLAMGASLICGVVDGRTGIIPNRLTYPVFAALLLTAGIAGSLPASLLGTLCVAGALAALHFGTHGRALGLGDVKLGACMGAGLGGKLGLVALGTACVAGAALGVALLASGRASRKDAVRFGPFLAFGSIAAYFGHGLGWDPLG